MDKKKKRNKVARYTFFFLFLCFIVSYAICESGYYEYELANKKILTEEQIKKFEEDVANGKDIDIEEYIIETHTDYTNKFTDATTKVATSINKYLKECIESIFGLVSNFVEE